MKRRLIASLIVALMLVVAMAAPAMAVEEQLGASVTVNELINFTVTDPSPEGLQFGTLNPGADDQPEANTPAVTLVVGAETNVDCNIEIKGSDNFDDGAGHTFAISNAKWDTDSNVTGATTMSNTYANVGTSTAGSLYSQDIWHWLSIPDGQYAATYNATFYYQAVKTP